eukprot:gb/GECG01011513.1/.p1 GENE.gb/GECG01011513.1/~~gb/GECG01011513.1/.p1  ORF type:complete len:273 (+),score=18.88 gb/GECG01011513.1/:1-819(+)
MTNLSATVDRMTLASILEYTRCPGPANDSMCGRGTQNKAFTTKAQGFEILVRYARRGDSASKMSADAHTLIHPSMAFRLGTCTLPSGKTGELYWAVSGRSIKRARTDLDLDTIFNVAFDALETFGFLHSGNPYGWAGHNDFAVAYFQNRKGQPRIKNLVVDFDSKSVHLFDFDSSTIPKKGLPFTQRSMPKSMRTDLKGVGYVLWHLAGRQLSRERVSPENNRRLVESCSLTLRSFCEVAHQCLDSSGERLTAAALYEKLVKSVPQELSVRN